MKLYGHPQFPNTKMHILFSNTFHSLGSRDISWNIVTIPVWEVDLKATILYSHFPLYKIFHLGDNPTKLQCSKWRYNLPSCMESK